MRDIDATQQCDKIGQFFKVSDSNLLARVAQIFGDFLGNFEKPYLQVKTGFGYFGGNF